MDRQPLTVSALTKYLKYCLDNDQNLQNIYLKGEVSNFKNHSRGHFYFTLKDENAQINAIMFATNALKVKFNIEDGMRVLVIGHVTVYPSGGSYQIYVSEIILDGIGQLYQRFAQLKEKLRLEGLFDESNKKPLPKIPRKIGIITSTTGAAIRDILTTIEKRFPLVQVVVFKTLVQGEMAKYSIVKSLELANKQKDIDVIILGRGGGSIEDLWCFNEEMVAYAIHNSRIPIISAVGHETDFTIADFVADVRALTPTAAGVMAVPDKGELHGFLLNIKGRLYQRIINILKISGNSLENISKSYAFRDPKRIFEQYYVRLDKLMFSMEKHSPENELEIKLERLRQIRERLINNYEKNVVKKTNEFNLLGSKFELINPLNIINRGYALVRKGGKTIQEIGEIAVNDQLEVLLKDGTLECIVTNKEVKV